MRILHTISSVDPSGGGPIEGIKQLGLINEAQGHQIEVASLDSSDAPFLQEFPFPIHPLGPCTAKYGYSLRFIPWLQKNLWKYDVVVVNGIWQYNSFATWQTLRGSATPYVVFTHGMLDPWFKRTYPLKHLKKWLYWPWAEYRVLRDAAAVLFTCEEERRLARQSFWLYSANEKVVSYGTAAPIGNCDAQIHQFLQSYRHLCEKRIVLFLGRIHVKKGCDLAIKAFAATLAQNPSYHLVIAGPDQTGWKADLASLASNLGISNRMTWTGMLTGDQKWGALHAADVFFLPSHQENFGIAVAESLACGVPVLISNKVNIWREVQQDSAGFVAEDDLAGSRSLLESWSDLPEAQKLSMRQASRKCFESRFEVSRASANIVDVLEKLIARRSKNDGPLEPRLLGVPK